MTRIGLLFGLTLAMTGAAARATPPVAGDQAASPSARLVLVDDETHDGLNPEDWRLQADSFAPQGAERDDLQWRVKVRPNRAMGRMSLAF